MFIMYLPYFQGGARKNPYSVAIRWAAWCPVSNLHAKDQTVNLIGGPGPNPEDMLLFHSQTAESIGSTASLSSLTGGTVTFSFNCSLPVCIIYSHIFVVS